MRFILGLMIGIAAGAAVGLILAPRAGKAARDSLAGRLQSANHEAEEAVNPG